VVHFAPGHTKGHCALLYTPDAALFSGDTLAWSERLGRLTLWPRYNWWRFDAQRESVAALGRLPWRVVLPGHGRRRVFDSDAERAAAVEAALRAEEGEGFS
jgi:glyoxylase-like metal-dependent hydrolase (beta-lactamase superfamily II)